MPIFRLELSKHTTCVMFQQQKLEVLLHSLHVYGLSPVWALLTTYIKNAHFSFRTLKTHHLCDVSATEVEVLLHSLHVYGLSPVWALSTIYIKNTHFRSELSKHTTCVMFQQQKLKFCCIPCTCMGYLQYGPYQLFISKIPIFVQNSQNTPLV